MKDPADSKEDVISVSNSAFLTSPHIHSVGRCQGADRLGGNGADHAGDLAAGPWQRRQLPRDV